MSFDDFRKTVRRAGIEANVLSDDELQRIVEIVDSDGRCIKLSLKFILGILKCVNFMNLCTAVARLTSRSFLRS